MIGDLVASRRSDSRGQVQAALEAALEEASRIVPPLDRLEPTVGDEFQGSYPDLGSAVSAALLVRLHLLDRIDARFGIGVGERQVYGADRTPILQDGPAWWGARAALEVLGEPAHRSRRTWYDDRHDVGAAGPMGLVNAFLLTRDALVDRLNDRARRMLCRSLGGATQREIAREERVSESAVSQAFGRGVGAVRDAQHMLLADLDPPDPERES